MEGVLFVEEAVLFAGWFAEMKVIDVCFGKNSRMFYNVLDDDSCRILFCERILFFSICGLSYFCWVRVRGTTSHSNEKRENRSLSTASASRVNGGMGKVLDTNKFGEMQENNSLLISYLVSHFAKQ
jgi:hypothetical protein